jgi:hypothetical protein
LLLVDVVIYYQHWWYKTKRSRIDLNRLKILEYLRFFSLMNYRIFFKLQHIAIALAVLYRNSLGTIDRIQIERFEQGPSLKGLQSIVASRGFKVSFQY